MIQRPQTLFLLLAAALLVLFVLWIGEWTTVLSPAQTWLIPVAYGLAAVSGGAALVAVALFKQRGKQRTAIISAQWLDLLLTAVVLVGLFMQSGEAMAQRDLGQYVTSMLPLLAYVMLRIARSGVQKDIDKVRSADRLR